MSVRAFRVKKIDINKESTFDLWRNEKLVEFLDITSELDEDLGSTIKISIDVLEEAVDKKDELKLDEFVVNKIKKDIKIAKKNGNEYITYYCC